MARNELSNQIEAGGIGHQIVDDEHVDRALGQRPLRLAHAAGFDHVVTFQLQSLAQRSTDLLLVVDEKEGTAPGAMSRLCFEFGGRAEALRHRNRAFVGGEVDADLGAAAGTALEHDDAAHALDDVLGNRKTEARARAFGREVRIEHARQVFGFDADATVTHEEPDGFPHGGCFDLDIGHRAEARSTGETALAALRAATAWRALVRILTSAMRSRSASMTMGRSAGSGLMTTDMF